MSLIVPRASSLEHHLALADPQSIEVNGKTISVFCGELGQVKMSKLGVEASIESCYCLLLPFHMDSSVPTPILCHPLANAPSKAFTYPKCKLSLVDGYWNDLGKALEASGQPGKACHTEIMSEPRNENPGLIIPTKFWENQHKKHDFEKPMHDLSSSSEGSTWSTAGRRAELTAVQTRRFSSPPRDDSPRRDRTTTADDLTRMDHIAAMLDEKSPVEDHLLRGSSSGDSASLLIPSGPTLKDISTTPLLDKKPRKGDDIV